MALTYTPDAQVGMLAPDFNLTGTDDKLHSLKEFKSKPALLVMFICNHCPYVKAIENRLIQLAEIYAPKGLAIVAISSNDVENYPEDSFVEMKLKNYPFPYLIDETQEVARAYDAVCTPDFFLFDQNQRLQYRGRLDDSWKDPAQIKTRELAAAIVAVLSGNKVSSMQPPSMGCNIKWKNAVKK